MKIALVNVELGYPVDFWPSRKQSIGMGYMAAVLQAGGYETKILEERFSSHEDVLRVLETERFDIVGFKFVGFELSNDYLKAKIIGEAFDNPMTRAMKAVRKNFPDTLIVAGSHSASLWDEEALRLTPADMVVRGEAELSMLQIARAKEKGLGYETVDGISWLRDGAVCRTKEKLADMEALPRPIRLERSPSDWVMVNSSRGCYGQCSFCSTYALYGEQKCSWWRARSPSSVVEEIADEHSMGFKNIQFAEDNFVANDAGRARRIANKIITAGLDVSMRFDTRVTEVEEPLFRLLKEAGLKRVYLGYESGSDRDLNLFHKGTTTAQNIRAVRILKSLGIQVNPGLIMFHPLSDLESIEDNIRFVEMIGDEPPLVQLASEMFIYKGTLIHRDMEARGLLTRAPLTTYQIVDPAVHRIHKSFMQYVRDVQSRARKEIDITYRIGDIKREVVYQTSGSHLQFLKDLVADARRRFI